MLKWIVGAALITVIATIVVTWKAESCKAPDQQSQTAATTQPFTNLVPTVPNSKNGNTQQEKSPEQTNRASYYANNYFCSVVTPANLPTIYLVLIGFGGIAVAIGTLKAIERQADLMEKSLKVVEAADVSIESASLVPAGAITLDSHISIRFKNFGRTRAENVRSCIVTIVPGCPNSEPSPDTFSIAGGGTQLMGFLNFRQFLSIETFRKIETGTISVRFSGKVTYSDRFGDSHTLECKGVLDAKSGIFILGDSNPRNESENPN